MLNQKIAANATSPQFTQSFGYDALNRLNTASEGSTWTQNYGYDRFGNRWVSASTGYSSGAFTPVTYTNYAATLDASTTNRVFVNTPTYDAAGHQTVIGGYGFQYDAEGRLKQASLASVAVTAYVYDGLGHRVEKLTCPAGTAACNSTAATAAVTYVYDALGRLVTEYGSSAANGTRYLTADHLGSTRLVTDAAGAVKERHDYLPFGEELPASLRASITDGGVNTYAVTNGPPQKFTGKERDSETNLDYFGARYFSGAQGRFTSPDPLLNSGRPSEPQSWNRYSYTLNNPLRYTDPLGMYVWGNCTGDADKCKAEQQRFRDSIAKAKEALNGLDPKSKEAKALQKTLAKLGDEGKGNIKINFGDAGSTDGQPNYGRTVGNSVTINYDAVDSTEKAWSLDASESSAFEAGLTTHEGMHSGGGPGILGLVGMHGEHAAYFTESVTYQGLHNTDRPFALWNESWLKVDRHQLEQKREQAIQDILHPQKPQDQKKEN